MSDPTPTAAPAQTAEPDATPQAPPAATPRRPSLSNAMLEDLLNNTLDPGYRSAAGRVRTKRRWDGPMVWLGCIAVGLLLVVAYQQSHLSAPAADAARAALISRIKQAQANGDRMESQAKQLSSEVATLRNAQLPANNEQLKDSEIAAGVIAVSGPGMQIELSEPPPSQSAGPGRPGTTPQSSVAVLNDIEIRAVVNELWADGAEAISINGSRITPLSFIRVAGESVEVDFRPLNPPYLISAIGSEDGLQVAFAQSAIARQLKTLVAVDGIGFSFGGKSKLELPSVTVGQLHYASPGPAPGPSRSGSPAPTGSPASPSNTASSTTRPSKSPAGPPVTSPAPTSTETR